MNESQRLVEPTAVEVSSLAILRGVLRRSRPRSTTLGERMQAVILTDFVAESVAKIASSALSIHVHRDAMLPKVLGDLDQKLVEQGRRLALRSRVETLHEIRNLVQHRGVAPSESDAASAAEHVDDFAEELCNTVWGLSFRKLSRAQWVRDERLRVLMEHAEKSLAAADRDQALAAVSHAGARFRLLLRESPSWFQQQWSYKLPQIVQPKSRAGGFTDFDLRRLGETIDDLVTDTEGLRAGLVGPDYEWFRRLIPEPIFYVGGGATSVRFREPGPTLGEVERASELLLDWILSSPLEPEPPAPPVRDRAEIHVVDLPQAWPPADASDGE